MVPPLGGPHMCISTESFVHASLTTGSSDLRRALEDSQGGVIRLGTPFVVTDVTRSDYERERLGYINSHDELPTIPSDELLYTSVSFQKHEESLSEASVTVSKNEIDSDYATVIYYTRIN
ncbi:unnamed protein product [Leuciscus chuanchicus]